MHPSKTKLKKQRIYQYCIKSKHAHLCEAVNKNNGKVIDKTKQMFKLTDKIAYNTIASLLIFF